MPTTPNRHFFTQMYSGSRHSPINNLKYDTWVKFALALLREKGQVGRLGAQRRTARSFSSAIDPMAFSTISHKIGLGPVAELVGIEGGVVSGVFNLESSSVGAPDRRPRHEENYHEA